MALNDVQQLSPTGVTAGVYPNASITVDSQGRISLASGNPNSVSSISAGPGITGGGSGAVTLGIAPSGVTAGTYTNTNLTVDATGRITAASPGPAPVPPTPPSGNQTFTSPGIFLVPTGVSSVLVTMIGGGGGGGAQYRQFGPSRFGGGGGGGGQVYAQLVPVTAGQNIPVTVGSGGGGGPIGNNPGGSGGSSSFLSVTCTGGGGGQSSQDGGGGAGGGSPNGNPGSPSQGTNVVGYGGAGGSGQLAGYGGGGPGGTSGGSASAAGSSGQPGKVFISWG